MRDSILGILSMICLAIVRNFHFLFPILLHNEVNWAYNGGEGERN